MLEKNNMIEELIQIKASLETELAKVERNNNKSREVIKVKEKEISELKKENVTVTTSLVQVQTDMAAFTAKVKKEKKDYDKKLRKQSKTDFVEELKSQTLKYECYVCDAKLESFQKLKSHVKIYHFTNNSTQTQTKTIEEKSVQCSKLTSDKAKETCEEETVELEFEKYPCFYCDREIASELEAL